MLCNSMQVRDPRSDPGRHTIRAQLAALALATVVPLAAAAGYVIVDRYREARSQAEAELQNLAATTATNIDREVSQSKRLLEVLAKRPLVAALDPTHCDPILAEFLTLHPESANLVTRTVRGDAVCSLLPQPLSADAASRFPWSQQAIRSGGFAAGDAFLGTASGRWVSVLTYPLRNGDGAIAGLLALPLDLLKLQSRILPAIPGDVVISVIDTQGRFLMRSADPDQWIGRRSAEVPVARGGGEGAYRVSSADGVARVIAYRRSPLTGWLVTVGIPADTLFAPVRYRIMKAIALVLATLAFALMLARRFGNAIARPIQSLEATVERVADGDLGARAALGGPDELATVAREFNRMLDVRERDVGALRDLNRTLSVLIECNEAMVRATNERQFFDEMCRILVQRGGHALAWIGYADDDEAKSVRPAAMYGATGYLEGAKLSWGDDVLGRGPTGTAIRTGKPAVVRDTLTDVPFGPWRESASRHGFRSSIALPLGSELPAFGALCIYSTDPARYNDEEVRLLVELASDLTYGIESLRAEARRRESERAQRESDERLRQIAENISEVFWLTDPVKNALLYVSPAYAEIWQRSVAELYLHPRQWFEAIHPDDRDRMAKLAIEQHSIDGYDEEYRIVRPDGSVRWIRDRACPVRDASGKVYRIVGTAQDITERKLAELHIKNLNRIYAVLSQTNALIVRVRERDELFREACRIAVDAGQLPMAWIGIVDRSAQRVVPVASDGDVRDFFETAPDAMTEIGTAGPGIVRQAIMQMLPVISNDAQNDPRIVAKAGFRERGINAVCVIPLQRGGEAIGVIALYSRETGFFDEEEMKLLLELAGDIAFALDHIEKSERLDYVAYYDVLTGLPNRSLFSERLTQRLKGAGPEQTRHALVLLDIERFKAVNDSLGRRDGDELLKQVANRLLRCAGDSSRVARFGADHFAMLLPATGSREVVGRALDVQLRACFGEAFAVGGTELRVSARAGIALSPEDGADAETLHRNAEAALKKAKILGEKQLFYTRHMTESAAEKLSLENKLRLALERNEFVLHYQTKVDVRTRRICGVEALMRWQSPELGLVPPAQFIPLMEETGMILEAGEWALRRAALDHRRWQEHGVEAPRIAVNVSPIQLRKPDFVQTVRAAVLREGESCAIDLEITESLIMEDVEDNITKLDAVRAMGVGIAVDDFGTGYSSLNYLAKLPVQTLKIDRAFISAMLDDSNTMLLVSTIVSLAHSLGLRVVAEGVDSERQADVLRGLKCDEMQGYLISRPVPPHELEAMLRADRALATAASR
ncbi:MAG: EAL domain-containing protein [Betaproteobacteria bacterium]|nr:EAL domain-containing protein [Betaproteobacteria bacterium]